MAFNNVSTPLCSKMIHTERHDTPLLTPQREIITGCLHTATLACLESDLRDACARSILLMVLSHIPDDFSHKRAHSGTFPIFLVLEKDAMGLLSVRLTPPRRRKGRHALPNRKNTITHENHLPYTIKAWYVCFIRCKSNHWTKETTLWPDQTTYVIPRFRVVHNAQQQLVDLEEAPSRSTKRDDPPSGHGNQQR